MLTTPQHIKQELFKRWQKQYIQKQLLSTTVFTPLEIKLSKPSIQQLKKDFNNVTNWIQELQQHSKNSIGYGYQIHYQTITHKQLGDQNIPVKISFEHVDDLLAFMGKTSEYKMLINLLNTIIGYFPELHQWASQRPNLLLSNQDKWHQLLETCNYFRKHDVSQCMMRQLSIPGVDLHFIKNNQTTINQLLLAVLPQEKKQVHFRVAAPHGFEKRFILKYEQPLIRFRYLDNLKKADCAFTDMTVPLDQLQRNALACDQVFITSSKVNGLCFPHIKNSIIIFAAQISYEHLSTISWLNDKKLYFWGDIATRDLLALTRLRTYFPKMRSLLMDQITLDKFSCFWQSELDQSTLDSQAQQFLNPQEKQLYQRLMQQQPAIYLPQESISYHHVTAFIAQQFNATDEND